MGVGEGDELEVDTREFSIFRVVILVGVVVNDFVIGAETWSVFLFFFSDREDGAEKAEPIYPQLFLILF